MHDIKYFLLPLILTSPLSLSFVASNNSLNVIESQISSGTYGPFYGGDEITTIDLSYKHKSGINTAQAVIEIYSIPTKLEASYSNGYREYIGGTTYNFTFNVEINKYILPRGVYIWFFIYEKDTNNILFYDSRTVYPASKHEDINIKNLTNYTYTSTDYLFSFSSTVLTQSKNRETIYFTHFVDDIFYQEEYGKSSFNGYISYEFNKALSTEGKIYLFFDDKYEIFPYLKTIDNKKVIEFTFKRRSRVSIYYDISMVPLYVNYETYETSYLPRSGFQSTNYFYFPKNRRNEVEGMLFQICFETFGASKSEYYFDGIFSFNKNHIGNCNNSTYCVNGEIGND